MKIGIFGGSFDPIHKGHVRVALKAYKSLDLDTIYFVPAKRNPLKKNKPASPFHRMGMLALALKGYNQFKICDFELNSSEKSYTYLTIKYFKEKFPNTELFVILGADNVKDFDKWYKFSEILTLAKLVLFGRNNQKINCPFEYIFINAHFPYSSSQIRSLINENKDISKMVIKPVKDYIKKHSLYI